MIDPKWQEMAEEAAAWLATPEGQAAAEQAVVDARNTVNAIRKAQTMYTPSTYPANVSI